MSSVSPVVLGVLWIGLAIGPLATLNARQSATFLVRAGAFTTPPPAAAILTAGTFTIMFVLYAGQAIEEAQRGVGVDAIQIVALVVMLLVLALQWYAVLGPFGVFLRPDGVLDR